MRKALGIVLALLGLLLALIPLFLWQSIGMFLATIASLPAFLILFYGYSLCSGGGLKRAIGQWLVLAPAILLMWSVILPFIYQILSLAALVIMGTVALLWYRRKLLSQYERKKTGKDPTEVS